MNQTLRPGILLLFVVASTLLLYPSLRTASGENPIVFVLGIALTLGLLLTGIATIRADVFPRWASIPAAGRRLAWHCPAGPLGAHALVGGARRQRR